MLSPPRERAGVRANLTLSCIVTRGLLPLRSPQVVRPFGIRFERQFHLASGARRLVSGENNFEDDATVFPGHQGLAVILDAIDKMRHLLWKTVVPFLLVNGARPALGRAGLFHCVVVALGAEGLDGVAVVKIGVSHTL